MTTAIETREKRFYAPFVEVKDDGPGSVQAAFSVFNVIDSDGDVVKPSAFQDGQEVAMVWSHNWDQPIGKGTVKVGRKQAVFDGHFFLDTMAGLEAWKTVKAMDNLQEWSFGFRVLEAEDGTFEEMGVQFLKKLELFEVSPVLIGANRETRTLSVKLDKLLGSTGNYDPLSGFKDMMEEMRGAMGAMRSAMARMDRAMGMEAGQSPDEEKADEELDPDAGKQADGWEHEADDLIDEALAGIAEVIDLT